MNSDLGGSNRSTFLFSVPTWLDGFASVFDLSGRGHSSYASSKSGHEADRRALRQDWCAVGDGLRDATATHARR